MSTSNGMTVSDEIGWWTQALFPPKPDPAPQPESEPVDIAAMSMEEYVRNRDRLGVRDSNGILGTEIRPWQRTTATNKE